MTTVSPFSSPLVTTLPVIASKLKQITTSKSKQHGTTVYFLTFLPCLDWLNLLVKTPLDTGNEKCGQSHLVVYGLKIFLGRGAFYFAISFRPIVLQQKKGTAEKRAPNWMGLNFNTSLYTFSTSDGVYQTFSH